MKIYTAYFKYSQDDYYTEHNRKMFLNREDADAFLTDLLNYEHIERYYVLEEEVLEQFVPMDHEITSDWECHRGTLHTHDDICNCDEWDDISMYPDKPQDNEF
jgi:hypothetical protein